MGIKTIPLSRLEAELKRTLTECAESGQALLVELPDHRLLVIQSLDAQRDDSLIDDLIATNPEFQELLAQAKADRRKPFTSRAGG